MEDQSPTAPRKKTNKTVSYQVFVSLFLLFFVCSFFPLLLNGIMLPLLPIILWLSSPFGHTFSWAISAVDAFASISVV